MGGHLRKPALVTALILVASVGTIAEAQAQTVERSDGLSGLGPMEDASISVPTTAGTGPTATTYGAMSTDPVICGEVIVESTKLMNDVGPCPYESDGIIIGRDNIKLDLNGFRVFGTPRQAPLVPINRGVGIRLPGRSNVEITSSNKGGTVTEFDAGVAIEGGENNHVYGLNIVNNVGSGCGEFGDGVVMIGSVNNDINFNNTISGNGPFDGVGLLAGPANPADPNSSFRGSSDNVVKTNVINNNARVNLCRTGHEGVTEEDDGVRLEPGSAFNTVKQNEIRFNGLDGVAGFIRSTDNVVRDNLIDTNGIPVQGQLHRPGDGVRLFPGRVVRGVRIPGADRTDIQSNDIVSNGEDGIRVQSQFNEIFTNKTAANVEHDLHDDNPGCDSNIWRNNKFLRVFQGCEAG